VALESAPLVSRLVEDLVHTTESYRTLKLGLAKQGQEAEQWQAKADALRRDAERVLQENNRLHMDLLEATEKIQKREREDYQAQVRPLPARSSPEPDSTLGRAPRPPPPRRSPPRPPPARRWSSRTGSRSST